MAPKTKVKFRNWDVNIMHTKNQEHAGFIIQKHFCKRGIKSTFNSPYSAITDKDGTGETMYCIKRCCENNKNRKLQYLTLMFRSDLLEIP
eukprot:UN18608